MDNRDLLADNPEISEPDKADDLFEEFSAYFEDEDGPGAVVKALLPDEYQQMVVNLMWQSYQDGSMSGDD